MSVIIGIDPGAKGAVAVYLHGEWQVFDCPTVEVSKKKTRKNPKPGQTKGYISVTAKCDPAGMSLLLREHNYEGVQVFMEKVGAMPKQGVTSTFGFGEGYGMWKGILATLEMPWTEVTPQRWKKAMLDGMTKDKGNSLARAKQLFPYLAPELKLKKNDGRAEAALIGEYGRRQL